MSGVVVRRWPLDHDLVGFARQLQQLQVPHRFTEEGGAQVLWVPEQAWVAQVERLYQRYEEDPQWLPQHNTASSPAPRLKQRLLQAPVSLLVLALSLLVALLSGLGERIEVLSWLNFQAFTFDERHLYFLPLQDSLAEGQWWRLWTPALVHFGLLHLAMNGLWYWELGRRIEAARGGWTLLWLTLSSALVANLAQYLIGGPGLFGGLSGVLYALLGYCWWYQRLCPQAGLQLPAGVLVMMLVWLLLCLSGLITALGFGQIANAAHVGGLLLGCLLGLLAGLWARRTN